MLRIGLTGGIGSGKSAVAEVFRRLGVPVIDTDEIARELVEPGLDAFREIVDSFGPEILDEGRLSRARLRARVFADPEARKRLEGILHPRIRAELRARVARTSASYCVVVIPLLFETRFRDCVDRVLVVDATDAARIERLERDRKMTRAEIDRVLAAQVTREERLAGADDLIENNGPIEELKSKVADFDRLYRDWSGP